MIEKYFITGSNGQLGKEFVKVFTEKGISFSAPAEDACDITSHAALRALVISEAPTVIINCAAYNAVDVAEENKETAYSVNAEAVANLATIAKEIGALFIHYSTDYVFDGEDTTPYSELSTPHPMNVYGKSKLKGETAVQESGAESLVFRTSWVYGEGTQNFLFKLSGWAEKNEVLCVTSDEVSVPTYTQTIVDVTLRAIEKELCGLYHLTNSGTASRFEVAQEFIKLKGLSNTLTECSIDEFNTAAHRPKNSAMTNAKLAADLGIEIPTWQAAMKQFLCRD